MIESSRGKVTQQALSPYKGYYHDYQDSTRFTIKKLKNEEEKNVTSLEVESMKYALTFNDNIAERYCRRRIHRLHAQIFYKWRAYCFRFILMRKELQDCFVMKIKWRHFIYWRRTIRKDVLLRRITRRKWKNIRRMSFTWWKYGSRWLTLKRQLLRRTFKALKNYVNERHTTLIRKRNYQNGTKIIRQYRKYASKKRYCATVIIKRFIMRR